MAKLRNFTLDGEAIRLTAYLDDEDKPVYEVELLYEYGNGQLSSNELLRFAQAMSRDAENWDGLLHRFPEEQFTNGMIAEFEETWGGGGDVQAQGSDECGQGAE